MIKKTFYRAYFVIVLSYQYYSLALFSPSCQLHQLLILVIYLQRNSGHAFLGMNDQDQSLPETGGGDSFRLSGGDHGRLR